MIGWQVKLIAAAVLIAALGGLLWHDKHQTDRANRLAREVAQAEATITAEREARAHEKEIADAAIKDLDQRRTDLEAARAATPTRSVRLCRSASPAVSAASGAAIGTDAGATGEQPAAAGSDLEAGPVAGPDIGAALYALADQADQRAAQCNALIQWVRSR